MHIDQEVEDGDMEVYARDVDHAVMQKNIDGMNSDQRGIFDLITNAIREQHELKIRVEDIRKRADLTGRVKLRRNINPPNGMVNGATGTLLHIETDDKGEALALRIQFDNIPEPQQVFQVSATFDHGLDEQITRRQFPVCTAFAATTHKCQGLTLRNALISTKGFFAAGQGFVDFSRVQNLAGLHLLDFCYDKIYCDPKALRNYNYLRKSVNLPAFVKPVRIKHKGK